MASDNNIPTGTESAAAQPNFTGRAQGGPGAQLFKQNVRIKDTKGTIKRILIYMGKKRAALILVFLCALITTLISITSTRLNGYCVDSFIATKNLSGLAVICFVMLGIYFINIFSTYGQNILMVSVAQRTAADIRKDLFSNLQKLPLRYFDTHSSGDLMSRLTNDIDNINTTLSTSTVQFFSGIISLVGMLIAMLILSPVLTLIGLSTIPIMFLTTKFIARRSQPYFVGQQRELGLLNGYMEEMVSAQKVVRLFSREETVKEEFSAINERLVHSAIIAQAASSIMGPINNVINNVTYLLVAVAGGVFIINSFQNMTVGIIFSFLLYLKNFIRPINDVLNLFSTIQSALAGAERVFDVIDEDKETDLPGAADITSIHGDVAIEKIDFSYTADKQVLSEASLNASQGQTVAIVGPTGAGKTTIINLLTKFYGIDSGRILIDGRDISEITSKSLRKSISIVLQDPYLFSETVMENIRYGRLNASDKEVIDAAKMAYAHDFILQLPDGYDTVLSDNGGNLSQGQRQLLSIARAIISNSSVLILDEATSSVDTRTEIMIQNALLTLMKGKTCFVIAHRLSTIRNADKIVVINDGRVVEAGTHDELMKSEGFYAGLYNSQFRTGTAI